MRLPRATPAALGAVRACVCAVFLVQAIATSFQNLAVLPVTLYAPTGIMRFIPWSVLDLLFTSTGMFWFKVALVTSLLSAAAGYLTRWTLPVALVLEVVYQGVLRGFGHFNHDEMAGLIILGILASSPSGDGFAIDRLGGKLRAAVPRLRYGYPILLAQAVIAWAYFSAGLLKLRLAGLEYFSTEQLPVLAIKHSLDNLHDTSFTVAFMLPSLGILLSLATLVTVAWEVLFPLGVLWRRTRVYYLATGLVFHLTTMVLMNITFSNMMGMYLIFVNWPRVGSWIRNSTVSWLGWARHLYRWAMVPERFPEVRWQAAPHAGTLWWDGTCGFCAKMVERLNQLVARPVATQPFQLVDRLPPEIEEWTGRQMHWVASDGSVVGGSRALVAALRQGGRPTLAWFLALPPIRPFTWLGYRMVAGNRDSLGPLAGAACDVPTQPPPGPDAR